MKIIRVFLLFFTCASAIKLDETYKWKELPFAWQSEDVKLQAVKSGKYIERNNLILGLDAWGDKLFITVPRLRMGVASTLNYIKLGTGEKSPVLNPYPSWDAHNLPNVTGDRVWDENNSTIVCPFRIRVDECDRLWVMDYGVEDVFGSANQVAPANIAIFDLKTDKLIRRFIIPSDQMKPESVLPNIVVDTQASKCEDAFAYIPDLGAYAVIVYDYKNNRSYKVEHNYFHFDPTKGNFNVDGINFQWTDGIFGLALGKILNDNGDRTVYFHAFASTTEFSVPNSVLKNESFVTSSKAYNAFAILGERGPESQASAAFYDDKTDVIFYTQVNRNAIGCWNVNKQFSVQYQGIVDSDNEKLIFPNDLKVDRNGTLYVLSDRFSTFQYSTLPLDYNNRIFTGKTSDLIKGTPCDDTETEPVRGQQQQPPPELSPYPYHYPAPYGYGQQRYYKKPHHQQRFRGGYGGSSEGFSGSDEEGF